MKHRTWMATVLLGLAVPAALAALAERPVLDESGGRRPWFSLLRPARETPPDQLAHADALRLDGRSWRARRQYRALIASWPAAPEAAAAQRGIAESFFEAGRFRKAFEAYAEMAERYPHGTDFEDVLARQQEIAEALRTRRRFLRAPAPADALPVLAWIADEAPHSPAAPAALLEKGRIHENAGDLVEAIDTYNRALQRYAGAPEAAEAIRRRAIALHRLSNRTPNDQVRAEEASFALERALRLPLEPADEADLRERLAAVRVRRAEALFDRARFYERAGRAPRAALTAYRDLVRRYPESPRAAEAHARIAELAARLGEEAGREAP